MQIHVGEGPNLSRHKVKPRCRHRRQMVGVLQCLIFQRGRQENGRVQAKGQNQFNRCRRLNLHDELAQRDRKHRDK